MNRPCNNRTKLRRTATALAVAIAVAAGSSIAAGVEMVPVFSLPDVNGTSSTYDQSVSPRDYLQQVSGWYFGYAT